MLTKACQTRKYPIWAPFSWKAAGVLLEYAQLAASRVGRRLKVAAFTTVLLREAEQSMTLNNVGLDRYFAVKALLLLFLNFWRFCRMAVTCRKLTRGRAAALGANHRSVAIAISRFWLSLRQPAVRCCNQIVAGRLASKSGRCNQFI